MGISLRTLFTKLKSCAGWLYQCRRVSHWIQPMQTPFRNQHRGGPRSTTHDRRHNHAHGTSQYHGVGNRPWLLRFTFVFSNCDSPFMLEIGFAESVRGRRFETGAFSRGAVCSGHGILGESQYQRIDRDRWQKRYQNILLQTADSLCKKLKRSLDNDLINF